MHGGIGFTWEHDTNVYYRRAIVLAACFGRAADYPQRVVDLATSTGMRSHRHRPRSRHREAARRDPRGSGCAEGDSARASATPRSPRAAGYSPTCRSRGAARRARSSRSSSPRSSRRAASSVRRWASPPGSSRRSSRSAPTTQQQRFLPPTFRGEMIWCQLFSEPGAGSDLASLTTKATKVDGGWRITGQKIWTTGAQFSEWGALLARTDPSAPKHAGHHLLPARHEERGRGGQAAARADRQRDVQHGVHRRRVRPRRHGAGRGQPRLGGQPQHADQRAGVDRQQRAAVPGRAWTSSSSSSPTASSTRSSRTRRAG